MTGGLQRPAMPMRPSLRHRSPVLGSESVSALDELPVAPFGSSTERALGLYEISSI
jgi:hypothetical protein